MRYRRIAAVASTAADAQTALAEVAERYPLTEPADADVIVALGGERLHAGNAAPPAAPGASRSTA